MRMPVLLATLLLAVGPAICAAGTDETLLGCWRSQQAQVTLADQSRNDQNGDCVTEYDAEFVRSRCYGASGQTETLSAYQRIGQDTLHITLLDPSTRQAKGTPSEIRYRVEDDWLLFDRQFPAGGTGARQPRNFKSVSVRVRPDATSHTLNCAPRGENKLRTGRAPVSSLALTLPPGWEPLLVDPYANESLRLAVNTSLFVGAFVPIGTSESQPGPVQMVLVLDDVRYGPNPIRQKDFPAVKKRFASELGAAKLTCDEQDRACAFLRASAGNQVYTELLNVNGRVAMVISSMVRAQGDALPVLRNSAQAFIARLRADNVN